MPEDLFQCKMGMHNHLVFNSGFKPVGSIIESDRMWFALNFFGHIKSIIKDSTVSNVCLIQ